MAQFCRHCKDEWQQKKGEFSCPSCNSSSQPRNLTRKENSMMNDVKLFCPASKCQFKNKPMKIEEF